jgi:hypothetical protein
MENNYIGGYLIMDLEIPLQKSIPVADALNMGYDGIMRITAPRWNQVR